ncbi:hypothetical protein K2Y00_04075 [Patescibacteria group bacterium]|nr:hypothetical protein [Patescibacteria group bacterium]
MDPIKQLKTHFRTLRLSDEERGAMRDVLLTRMRATQALPRIPSPYAGVFMTLTFKRMTAFVAFLAVITAGTGSVAAAAEGAVPGDTMYAVKVHFNERVATLTALTPSSRAAVATSHAERRLEEAEVLVARGELNETVAMELSERFSKSAEEAIIHIDGLTNKDLEEATIASVEFETVLSAHGRILDDIVTARADEVPEVVAVLRADLAERAETIARKRDESRLAFVDEEDGRQASERIFASVSRDAQDAAENLARESKGLEPEDVLALESRASAIAIALDEGRAKYERGAYGDALAEFERAKSYIGIGERLLEAKARFDEPGEMPEDEMPIEEPVEQTIATTMVEDALAPEVDTMMMATEMRVMATNTATDTATTTELKKEAPREFVPRVPRPIRINLTP